MSKQQELTFTRTVAAPPDQLYRAFSNATALREWFCDLATTAPSPGGHLFLKWNSGYFAVGEFTELVQDERVAFTWHGRLDPGSTTVNVTLQRGEAVTEVTVVHAGLGLGESWESAVAEFSKTWTRSLDNLASVHESGADLRFVKRPMLGITVSDFNAEVSAQLNVPVDKGIRIDGLVAGMGAEAAGLQTDDVVVGIGEVEIVDWPTLTQALARYQAGDTVDVIFYRGPEKQTLPMTLSGRPVPEIPPSVAELAEVVSGRYAEINADLDEFFAGVTEAEAAHQPAQGEWSAKEVLAHLIQGERGWQNWISEMVSGEEPWYDRWGGNVPARIAATLAVYPTADKLLAELHTANAETVALIANLPADFAARKSTYWRLAFFLLESPYHHRAHMEQMSAAIEAARA